MTKEQINLIRHCIMMVDVAGYGGREALLAGFNELLEKSIDFGERIEMLESHVGGLQRDITSLENENRNV